LAKNDGPKDLTVMEEAATSKTPQMIVLELEKTLGRNLPRKLSLNLGQTRLGGTYSTPTSPVPASPSYNSGCVNLKCDESAGRSKYKAGGVWSHRTNDFHVDAGKAQSDTDCQVGDARRVPDP
jgi:hypothetical protein